MPPTSCMQERRLNLHAFNQSDCSICTPGRYEHCAQRAFTQSPMGGRSRQLLFMFMSVICMRKTAAFGRWKAKANAHLKSANTTDEPGDWPFRLWRDANGVTSASYWGLFNRTNNKDPLQTDCHDGTCHAPDYIHRGHPAIILGLLTHYFLRR